MKELKLNLLEKKEMDEIRGGLGTLPDLKPKCECTCPMNHQNSHASWENIKKGIFPKPVIVPEIQPKEMHINPDLLFREFD